MYELQFPKEGRFPISLDFVAPLQTTPNSWYGLDFRVAASAVVPVRIKGFDAEIAFAKEQQAIVPMRSDKDWLGFLPATGRVLMRWQDAKSTGEGKSFFTTNTTMETTVGPA